MLVKALRQGLGRLIVFVDYVTRPKPQQRPAHEQAQVDAAAAYLSLYQFYACPFCVKTRRAIRRLNLPVEYRDAAEPGVHREELAREGGKVQVPCLRIVEGEQARWLYESDAIIDYLSARFGPGQALADANRA
jgi:glutaredoxin